MHVPGENGILLNPIRLPEQVFARSHRMAVPKDDREVIRSLKFVVEVEAVIDQLAGYGIEVVHPAQGEKLVVLLVDLIHGDLVVFPELFETTDVSLGDGLFAYNPGDDVEVDRHLQND